MKKHVYTIYDAAVGAYLEPRYYRNKGEALRAFAEAIKDPQCPFHKWPDQFTMFELGEYEDTTSEFTLHKAKVSLGSANEFKTPTEALKAV